MIWARINTKIHENTRGDKRCQLKSFCEKASFVFINFIWLDGSNVALSNGENRKSRSYSYQKLFATQERRGTYGPPCIEDREQIFVFFENFLKFFENNWIKWFERFNWNYISTRTKGNWSDFYKSLCFFMPLDGYNSIDTWTTLNFISLSLSFDIKNVIIVVKKHNNLYLKPRT